MADTIRKKVLDAVLVKMATIAGVNVLHNQDVPTQTTKLPIINVVDGGQVVVSRDCPFITYQMTLNIDGYVKSNTDYNDLYGKIVGAMRADIHLGSLTQNIDEIELSDPVFDNEKGSVAYTGFRVTFQLDFTTLDNDPTAQG